MSQFITGILIKKHKSINLFSKPGFSLLLLYYYHVPYEIINSINTCEIEGKLPSNETVRSASVPSFPRDLTKQLLSYFLSACSLYKGQRTSNKNQFSPLTK